jgi:hypothetical protein
MENQPKKSIEKKIAVEIGMEFLDLIFGNIYTKIGFSLMLLIIGGICILAPIENEIYKSKVFYIVGGILVLSSILLIFKRYLELKNIDRKKQN